jgi:Zn-dependent protease
MDIGSKIVNQLILLGLVFLSACAVITIHEFVHAFASWKFGDKLPKFNKRLTLNPASHIDIVGLIFMMATGFGWGKSVETSPRNYKDKQKGTILVGLAGPLVSLILAILVLIPFYIIKQKSILGEFVPAGNYIEVFLQYIYNFSFNLAFISLLPINPFDGFMIWGKIIKPKIQFVILQYQSMIFTMFLLIILIMPDFLQVLISPVTGIFKWSIANIVSLIL